MSHAASNKRVAILATDGFEQAELTEPKKALADAGAEVHVVSLEPGEIRGFRHFDKGDKIAVDRVVGKADANDYDALVIPGGLFNPDALRRDDSALTFARSDSRCRQAGGGDLSRPVGADQRRARRWAHSDVGRQHSQGPGKCRGPLGRQGGADRRQPDHQPHAGGSGCFQQGADRQAVWQDGAAFGRLTSSCLTRSRPLRRHSQRALLLQRWRALSPQGCTPRSRGSRYPRECIPRSRGTSGRRWRCST